MVDQIQVTFILGGARSGKSTFAEQLAEQCSSPVYLATGQAFDDEMRQRINEHQSQRGKHWTTVEEALELPAAITRLAKPQNVVLVDCLTLWLSNLLHAQHDVDAAITALVASLSATQGSVILVSNEVGLGIVPDNALAREFRDHAGRLHQAVAAVAQRVYFVVAGIPTVIKDQES